jgi:hypothetical protein
MVVAHFHTIQESLEAVTRMKHHLYTCEMMDDTILNCTKTNREQAKNRFFYSRGTQSGYYARSGRITVWKMKYKLMI